MKKKLLIVLSWVLCAACLIGCGTPSNLVVESGSDQPTVSESQSQATTVITDATQNSTQVTTSESTEPLTEAPTNTQSETQTEIPTETETEPVIETETQTETQTEAQTETQTDPPTETEKKTEKVDPIPGKTTTTETLKAKEYNLSKGAALFRYIGRSKQTTSGIICDHAASGIEFQGYMTGKVSITVSSMKADTYYTVYIDDKRVDTRFCAKEGNDRTIEIADFKGKYFHKIKILKQSEIGWTGSMLETLNITGYLVKAPANRDLYIEFYGDSLTAGFGNIGKPSSASPYDRPLYQDATQSFGFLFSEMAGADCSILAMSGVGLSVGYYDEPFLNYFSKYSHLRGSEKFNFTGARVPDLAVIHLGANDESVGDSPNNKAGYGESTGSFKTNFKNKAKELISYIREGYKTDVPIVWAYDPAEGVPNYIQEVLDELGGESAGLYILELKWKGIANFTGAGSHPSALAHEEHADLLAELVIKKKILK